MSWLTSVSRVTVYMEGPSSTPTILPGPVGLTPSKSAAPSSLASRSLPAPDETATQPAASGLPQSVASNTLFVLIKSAILIPKERHHNESTYNLWFNPH